MANGKANKGPAFPQARDSTSVSYQNSQSQEDTPLVVVGMGATHAQHETSGSNSALEMEFEGGRSWWWRAGEREAGVVWWWCTESRTSCLFVLQFIPTRAFPMSYFPPLYKQ